MRARWRSLNAGGKPRRGGRSLETSPIPKFHANSARPYHVLPPALWPCLDRRPLRHLAIVRLLLLTLTSSRRERPDLNVYDALHTSAWTRISHPHSLDQAAGRDALKTTAQATNRRGSVILLWLGPIVWHHARSLQDSSHHHRLRLSMTWSAQYMKRKSQCSLLSGTKAYRTRLCSCITFSCFSNRTLPLSRTKSPHGQRPTFSALTSYY